MIYLSPCVFQFRVLFPVFHNPQFPWNLLARLRRQHTMLRIWNTNPTSHWPSSTMLLGVEKSILSIPFTVWISLGYPTNTVAALGDPRVDCSRITKRYTHTHTHYTYIYIFPFLSLSIYIYNVYICGWRSGTMNSPLWASGYWYARKLLCKSGDPGSSTHLHLFRGLSRMS